MDQCDALERKAQQRLRDAIAVLADGFALFDAEDRLVICNDAFMHSSALRDMGDLRGITMAEILQSFATADVTDIRAKDDPEGWLTERLARHRNPTPDVYEQILTDGRVLHISERRTSDGGIVGIWRDVTALRQAERRLQDAIASINEGFMLLDAEGRYVVFNDELLQFYPKTAPHVAVGVKFEDALRQGALAGEYSGLTDPAEIERFVREWTSRFTDPAAFQGEGSLADGRWVLISHHGTSDGGCVNVYTDITLLKQRESDLASAKQRLEDQAEKLILLAEELERAKIAAEAANISKSHFLANMSHELRTPLNGILGFAEIIKTNCSARCSRRNTAAMPKTFSKAAGISSTLINDVLDLSKIEAEHMTLNIDAVETAAVVGQALHLVAALAAERGVTLDPPDIRACPVIHADDTQLRQILLNLLSNAVKFTPDHGRVHLRAVEAVMPASSSASAIPASA